MNRAVRHARALPCMTQLPAASDPVLWQGSLLKESQHLGRWNRRYFVLRTRTLAHYDDGGQQAAGPARAIADLQGAVLLEVRRPRPGKQAFRLDTVGADGKPGKYVLAALTDIDHAQIVKALERAGVANRLRSDAAEPELTSSAPAAEDNSDPEPMPSGRASTVHEQHVSKLTRPIVAKPVGRQPVHVKLDWSHSVGPIITLKPVPPTQPPVVPHKLEPTASTAQQGMDLSAFSARLERVLAHLSVRGGDVRQGQTVPAQVPDLLRFAQAIDNLGAITRNLERE